MTSLYCTCSYTLWFILNIWQDVFGPLSTDNNATCSLFSTDADSQKSLMLEKIIFSIFSVSYWHIYKEKMHVVIWDIINRGCLIFFSFLKKQKTNRNQSIFHSFKRGAEKHCWYMKRNQSVDNQQVKMISSLYSTNIKNQSGGVPP